LSFSQGRLEDAVLSATVADRTRSDGQEQLTSRDLV
jgi:hypothetical protein